MKLAILTLTFSISLLAQQPNKPKTFTPPDEYRQTHPAQPGFFGGRVENPVIAKDRTCAVDLARATAIGGTAGRKKLAELIQFGCAVKKDGIFDVVPNQIEAPVSENEVMARAVDLFLDEEYAITEHPAYKDRELTTTSGWVLDRVIADRLTTKADAEKRMMEMEDVNHRAAECRNNNDDAERHCLSELLHQIQRCTSLYGQLTCTAR